MTDKEAAWDALHTSLPPGWWVGQPSYHPERQEWLLYAYDPSERPMVGIRKDEWQAIRLANPFPPPFPHSLRPGRWMTILGLVPR